MHKGPVVSRWIAAVSSDQGQQVEIDKLVRRSGEFTSGALASNDDFGGLVWYTCPLAGEQPNLADPMFQPRVLEMLSTQVRISQWLRLGEYVLLNFREEVPEGGVQEGNFLIPRGRSLMSTSLFRDRSTDRSPVPSRTPSWR